MKLTLKEQNLISKKDTVYLFDLHFQETATNTVGPLVAASTSDFTVGIFVYENLRHVGSIEGHSDVISGLQFSNKDPHLLFTGSLDGSVRCWDLRTECKAPCFSLRGTDRNKFTSLSVSDNGVLIAAGTELEKVEKENEAYVVFWDMRSGGCLGSYSESHTDDITQVAFQPGLDHHLASGSTDGLVCVFDLRAASEDDAIFATFNTESSVSRLGWFGDSNIYVTTHLESVHAWEVMESDILLASKPLADASVNATGRGSFSPLLKYDYVTDCFFDPLGNHILCVGGVKGSGDAAILCASKDSFHFLAPFPSIHTDSVRSCAVDWRRRQLITGGEDGRICLWDMNDADEAGVGSLDCNGASMDT